jgi:hypothetical protein
VPEKIAEMIRKPDGERASELGGLTDTTKAPVKTLIL